MPEWRTLRKAASYSVSGSYSLLFVIFVIVLIASGTESPYLLSPQMTISCDKKAGQPEQLPMKKLFIAIYSRLRASQK
jgi:hypothetical protein